MARKTNKTSHVMDLLTNGASQEAEETVQDSAAASDTSPSGQEKKSEIQSHTVTPAKVTVVDEGSRNDRISQEILNKLSEELEEETRQEQQQAMQSPEEANNDMENALGQIAPEEVAAPSPEPIAASPEPETAAPLGQEQEVQELPPDSSIQEPAQETETPEAEESKPAPAKAHHTIIPKSQISANLADDEYRFVNVMEQLILRQDIDSFLDQYDVCKCRRCMADVCALALTGLPSKYVVTSTDSLSPILSYYESKYKIYMLTELIKACNKVRENPRHKKI
ncbi:late competence development ComFB family protein [Lachnospiraceae bacterium 62-35]